MAFGLRWSGSGAFFATEIRVQLHEWLAIVTGTLTPGALIVFVAILAANLLPVTLIGALVYSMFLIGQRVLNEAAYIRIDHKLNELYHASPLSPEGYFVGIAGGMLVAYLPPSLVVLGILELINPLGLVEVVGRQKDCGPFPRELPEHVPHGSSGERIEPDRRLVQE